MVQVIERAEGRYDLREVEFGEVIGRCTPERVVLECDCRARLILDGYVSVRRPLIEGGALECGLCGERLVLTRTATRREHTTTEYSWLEACLERIEGKEARHEYYARL